MRLSQIFVIFRKRFSRKGAKIAKQDKKEIKKALSTKAIKTMRNKLFALLALSLLVAVVLGCGSINPFSSKSKTNSSQASNKTLTDKGVDTVVGEESTGVPECDEVMDMIAAETNNPDDNFVTKAIKATFLNKIKESIKKSIEENKNKNGTADLAKNCTEFKKQLVKYKAEEEQKKAK